MSRLIGIRKGPIRFSTKRQGILAETFGEFSRFTQILKSDLKAGDISFISSDFVTIIFLY